MVKKIKLSKEERQVQDLAQENMLLKYENIELKKEIKEKDKEIKEFAKQFEGIRKDLVFIKGLEKMTKLKKTPVVEKSFERK